MGRGNLASEVRDMDQRGGRQGRCTDGNRKAGQRGGRKGR